MSCDACFSYGSLGLSCSSKPCDILPIRIQTWNARPKLPLPRLSLLHLYSLLVPIQSQKCNLPLLQQKHRCSESTLHFPSQTTDACSHRCPPRVRQNHLTCKTVPLDQPAAAQSKEKPPRPAAPQWSKTQALCRPSICRTMQQSAACAAEGDWYKLGAT